MRIQRGIDHETLAELVLQGETTSEKEHKNNTYIEISDTIILDHAEETEDTFDSSAYKKNKMMEKEMAQNALNYRTMQVTTRYAQVEELSRRLSKIAAKTASKKDDILAMSLKGKEGSRIIYDRDRLSSFMKKFEDESGMSLG